MDVIRDLLDAPIRDRRYRALGRVDGVTLELRKHGPPRLATIETGSLVFANRLGRRLSAMLQWLTRRAGTTLRSREFPIRLVSSIDLSVTLDIDAKEDPSLLTTEKWLSAHLRWGLFR